MVKIILEGQELDVLNDVTGEGLTSIEIRDTDTDEQRVRSVSQSYTLTGAAYNIVAALFINNPEGKVAQASVQIYESGCCEEDVLLFEGRLISDNVKWCHDECSVDVIFEEYTTDTKAFDCVRSKMIWDNQNNFKQMSHPRMVYCLEIKPDILFEFLVLVGNILNLILIVLYPIVAVLAAIAFVLNTIIDAINSISPFNDIPTFGGFDGNSETGLLQEYNNLINRINSNLVGCGRAHPSPLVRDYITNVCNICGISFSSTILNNVNSDYYNMVYLFAPSKKGTRDQGTYWIDENRPAHTLKTFLDELKPVFNAAWQIENGTLYFERKDFFWRGNVSLNYDQLNESKLVAEKLCLEWRNDLRPSFIEMRYQLDAIDTGANEVLNVYNEIVEWNNPYSSLQADKKEVFVMFAPPRFRLDGAQGADDSFAQMTNAGGLLQQTINGYGGVMLIEKHLTSMPKLIIWDGDARNFGRAATYIVNDPSWPGNALPLSKRYNFPLEFNELGAEPNTAYPSDVPNSALYKRFYAWENPKLSPDMGKQFTFSFKYSCGDLNNLNNLRYIQLPLGTEENPSIGRITQMSVNLQESTITIQGNV